MRNITSMLVWVEQENMPFPMFEHYLGEIPGVVGVEMKRENPCLVQIDYQYENISGISILQEARQHQPATYLIGM